MKKVILILLLFSSAIGLSQEDQESIEMTRDAYIEQINKLDNIITDKEMDIFILKSMMDTLLLEIPEEKRGMYKLIMEFRLSYQYN